MKVCKTPWLGFWKTVPHHEGHHSRRRLGHAALSRDARHQQAAAAGLRQANDLLPAFGADARRHPRHPVDIDARTSALLQESAGRRRYVGNQALYVIQDKPIGLAHAFILGREFVGNDRVALILGDNVFYGHGLSAELGQAMDRKDGATVFAYHVVDPSQYGVVTFDKSGAPTDIVEKPARPVSNWAVTGLYFYDNAVLDIAADLRPSARGEIEITDVNKRYLELKKLHVVKLGRGYAWLDTGTHNSLLDAGDFVRSIQHRQGLQIACLEEIAFEKAFIDAEQLRALISKYDKTAYGRYLQRLVDDADAPRSPKSSP